MGALRPWHIAVLVVVLILLFGAKRLPDAARSLGRSLRIIKAETKSLHEDGDLAEKADAQAGYQPLPPQAAPQQPYAPQQPPQQQYVQQPQQQYVQQQPPQQQYAQPVDPVQRIREN